MVLSKIDNLKQALFDQYNGFSDKRIKYLSSGSLFTIDDRNSGDFGAKKQLYSYFCSITAEVVAENKINVRLSGNVPKSLGVKKWISDNGAKYGEKIFNSLSFSVTPDNYQILGTLAVLFKQIVKRGVNRHEKLNRWSL